MYGLAACYAYSFGVEVRPRRRPAQAPPLCAPPEPLLAAGQGPLLCA